MRVASRSVAFCRPYEFHRASLTIFRSNRLLLRIGTIGLTFPQTYGLSKDDSLKGEHSFTTFLSCVRVGIIECLVRSNSLTTFQV